MKGFFASLRSRLMLLVLLALLPAFGVILYQAQVQRSSIQQRVTEQALSLAHQASKSQSDAIRESQPLLTTLAQLFAIVETPLESIDHEACDRFLTGIRPEGSTYANLGVIAKDGALICSALPFSSPVNLADRAYFQGAIETRGFFIGDYQIGRVTGRPTINAGMPILESSGQVKGVVFAALDLGSISDLTEGASLPPGTVIQVVDHNGVILMHHPEPEDWIGRAFPEAPIVKISRADSGPGTARVPGLDGVDRLFSFAPLVESLGQNSPMVNVGIPAAVAFADVDRALARNLAIMVLAGLLALVATWLAGELFVLRRVRTLVNAARKLAAGDLEARSGLAHSAGEINQLASAFDDMAAALQARMAEVQKSQEALQEAEQEVRERAAELARSNAELEQFAYIASHDLQEPLRSITGFTSLLTKRYRGHLGDDADRFMTRIIEATARMQRLINDLLTYSRVGREIQLQPTDCHNLVGQEIATMHVTIQESGAVVHCDSLPTVTADPTLLGQVFRNLIGNAIKFRGEAPPQVHISAERKGRSWVFAVRDNGIGIDPQYSERIFTIFERLHPVEEYPGTGIGLSICKKAVECWGGQIWVESQPGQGSTFYFDVPVTSDEVRKSPYIPFSQRGTEGDLIAVVS